MRNQEATVKNATAGKTIGDDNATSSQPAKTQRRSTTELRSVVRRNQEGQWRANMRQQKSSHRGLISMQSPHTQYRFAPFCTDGMDVATCTSGWPNSSVVQSWDRTSQQPHRRTGQRGTQASKVHKPARHTSQQGTQGNKAH